MTINRVLSGTLKSLPKKVASKPVLEATANDFARACKVALKNVKNPKSCVPDNADRLFSSGKNVIKGYPGYFTQKGTWTKKGKEFLEFIFKKFHLGEKATIQNFEEALEKRGAHIFSF